MARSLFVVVAALLIAGAAAQAPLAAVGGDDCATLAARMRSGPCAKLQDSTVSKTPQIIGMDCPALEKFKLTMPIAPEECCPDLRAFITQGCACSQDVIDLITMSGGTPENLRAAMKMAQSGQCADAAHGGPIIDVCTGSAGCPPA